VEKEITTTLEAETLISASLQDLVREMLIRLGEDPERDGPRDTPGHMERSMHAAKLRYGEEMKNRQNKHSGELPNAHPNNNWADPKKIPLKTSPVQTRKHRIVCVDDDIVGTTLRGEILEGHGYSVVLYHCPLATLRCDLSMFDLAVLDFQMPGLNGRELFLCMRALGARFPIVLLTGCVDALSYEDRVVFARCLDESRPIQCLLEYRRHRSDPIATCK
jgi:CheY-like chemotaxis protein